MTTSGKDIRLYRWMRVAVPLIVLGLSVACGADTDAKPEPSVPTVTVTTLIPTTVTPSVTPTTVAAPTPVPTTATAIPTKPVSSKPTVTKPPVIPGQYTLVPHNLTNVRPGSLTHKLICDKRVAQNQELYLGHNAAWDGGQLEAKAMSKGIVVTVNGRVAATAVIFNDKAAAIPPALQKASNKERSIFLESKYWKGNGNILIFCAPK